MKHLFSKPLSRQMRDHQGQNCCHEKNRPVLLEQYTQTDGKPFPQLNLTSALKAPQLKNLKQEKMPLQVNKCEKKS
jgi:hypothetical protein